MRPIDSENTSITIAEPALLPEPRCSAQPSALTGVILASLMIVGCGKGVPDNTYAAPDPLEVDVAKPLQHPVTLYIEENGETEVVERAEVRARVRGFLEKIDFIPGQKVTEGDVLYVIQQDEYKATVNSAKASLAAAKAAIDVSTSQVGLVEVEVTRAELEYHRFKALLAQEAATQAQYDQASATYQSAQANQKAAEANVVAANADRDQAQADLERAELDLGYTLVKAPISGRITKTEIKLGNLIENGDLLATIVNRDEIYANLNLSDRTLLKLQKSRSELDEQDPEEEDRYRGMPAYLRRELDDGYPFAGQLDYIDQEGVDQATGTFAVRAVFENPEDLILPGLFVRVRVPIGELEDAILIPEKALLRDQQGSYVLAVDEADQVERRSLVLGQTVSGMVVVDEGLGAEDRILLSGGQRTRPGTEIRPKETPLTAPPGLLDQERPPDSPDADSTSAPSDDASGTDSAQP